jgi:hypothetical protein
VSDDAKQPMPIFPRQYQQLTTHIPNRDSQRLKKFEKFAANRVLEEFSKSDSAKVIRALTAKDREKRMGAGNFVEFCPKKAETF